MAIRRSSTSLVGYLGAEVSARLNQSALANTVKSGQGGEVLANASVQRFLNSGLSPATVKISEYEYALGFMQALGIAPLTQKAMALVFVDAAKAQGTTVMHLLESVSSGDLSVIEAQTYNYINKLREATSQLSGSAPVNNASSYRARYLLP